MPGSRREELVASAGDQALAAWLGRLQDASFSRAGAVRKAYPPERRMTGPQLAGYLARRTYALVSSTRPDGRPHAAPTLFSLYAQAFWLPTLGSAARLGNVRAHPWLALFIIEGEHDTHAAVLTRGPGRGAGDRSGRCPEHHRVAQPRRQPGLGDGLAADDPAAAVQLRRARLAGRVAQLMSVLIADHSRSAVTAAMTAHLDVPEALPAGVAGQLSTR
jgi:Pyridoxamine 5'-phosphate oxidase